MQGKQRYKDDLIYLVKLAYTLQGKGKTRKRELSEILQGSGGGQTIRLGRSVHPEPWYPAGNVS